MTGRKRQNFRLSARQYPPARTGKQRPFRQPVLLGNRAASRTPTKDRLSRLRLCDSSAIRGPWSASVHGTTLNNDLREFGTIRVVEFQRNRRLGNKMLVASSSV